MVDRVRAFQILLGIAVLGTIVALVGPWWTVGNTSGQLSNQTFPAASTHAGPFRSSTTVDSGMANFAGTLTLAGLVGFLAALGMSYQAWRWGSQDPRAPRLTRWAPRIATGAALLFGLALLQATTTWPPSGGGFWEERSAQGVTFYWKAAYGWYAGVAGAVIGLVAAQVGTPKKRRKRDQR
jgi:hypothetical protein